MYFKTIALAFEYRILLTEQMVIAGKSILVSGYRGLSTMISMDEYEYVSHEPYKCTKIKTLATDIKMAHIILKQSGTKHFNKIKT